MVSQVLNSLGEPEPTLNYLSNCTCVHLKSRDRLVLTITSENTSSSEDQVHCVREAENRATKWRGQITCQSTDIPVHPDDSEFGSFSSGTVKSNGNCMDVKPTDWCEDLARRGACKRVPFRQVSFCSD